MLGYARPSDSAMKTSVKRLARGPNLFRWPARLVRLLGQVTDREVARRGDIYLQTVRAERQRRGIPPLEPRRPRTRWTKAMIGLLGTAIDKDVAAELGLPVMSVFMKRTAAVPGRPTREWQGQAASLVLPTGNTVAFDRRSIRSSCVALPAA